MAKKNNSVSEIPVGSAPDDLQEKSLYLDPKTAPGAIWPSTPKQDKPMGELWEAGEKTSDNNGKMFGDFNAQAKTESKINKNKLVLYVLAGVVALALVAFVIQTFRYNALEKKYSYTNTPKNSQSASPGLGTESGTGTVVSVKPGPKENFNADNQLLQIYEGKKVDVSQPNNLPDSKVFKIFNYTPSVGKVLEISGTCKDKYYVLVVFKSGDDYRTKPEIAKVNVAYVCPASGTYTQSLDLAKFNLPAGEYYFFSAEEGDTGLWYNPR